MKILHLSTNLYGGAGKATFRIHELMRKQGLDSSLIVRFGNTDIKSRVRALVDSYNILDRGLCVLRRKLMYKDMFCAYGVNDSSFPNFKSKFQSLGDKPDIIILHWVSGFLSLADIEWLYNYTGARILWYSMDMAPFTGGCHYSWGCKEYEVACINCPAARNVISKLKIKYHFQAKNSLIKKCKIELVVPNAFVESQAMRSGLDFTAFHKCYLPIDSTVFNTGKIRNFDNEIIILFGAADLKNKRKGLSEFIKVIRVLSDKMAQKSDISPVKLLIPGASNEIRDLFSVQCDFIEYAKSDVELNEIYSKAHVFVSTSLEDSGPMMVVESLMCGLPVFSFTVGVANDIISKGENGYCSPTGKIELMADNLMSYLHLSPQKKQLMSIRARDSVVQLMSVEEHINCFSKILLTNLECIK